MEEKVRKLTLRRLKEEVKTLENVFSEVRILRADQVCAGFSDCSYKSGEARCYEIWKKSKPCRNCISCRALAEKKQFTKLEKVDGKMYQVISSYVEADGKPYVIEMIKRFDEKMPVDLGGINDSETINDYYVKTYVDALTETHNRRYYEENLANIVIMGGVVMLDIDDFKIYNDLFGHDAGDAVLKAVAGAIKKCIRSTDRLVRYGGDEFLLIIPGINGESLSRCLSDISQEIRLIVIDRYPAIKPSVSAGGIICEDDIVKKAVSRADQFMYRAKKKKNYFVTENMKKDALDELRPSEKVLIVDDSDINREILSAILKNQYEIIEAASGEQCIEKIKSAGEDISLILLDLIMPGMSGFDVLNYLNDNRLIGKIPVITITGDESDNSVREAYEKGVSDYITRPFDARVVYRRVSNTVNLYSRQKSLIREIENEANKKWQNRTMLVEILSQIIEFRDGDESGGNHAGHMLDLSRRLLERLIVKTDKYAVAGREIELISIASALHDIGKVAIDKNIVGKKGRLTAEEFETMKTHTIIGEEMLNNISAYSDDPLIKYAKEICRWHHERYDGKGYPDGLEGDDIPVSAQVVSVCDVYDALISKRPYKPAYPREKAIKMIRDGECGAFNPLLVECLIETESNPEENAGGEEIEEKQRNEK